MSGIRPLEFGPWQGADDRRVLRSRDETYDRACAAAHTAADAADDLDWPVAAGSSVMRVHQHGASARRLGQQHRNRVGWTRLRDRR